MKNKTGKLKTTMDFKSRVVEYKGRKYNNGSRRIPNWGKCLQDFNKLNF